MHNMNKYGKPLIPTIERAALLVLPNSDLDDRMLRDYTNELKHRLGDDIDQYRAREKQFLDDLRMRADLY